MLEINPTHDLIKQLDKVADAEDKGDFHELADILHFQAQLSLGAIPEKQPRYVGVDQQALERLVHERHPVHPRRLLAA